MADPLSRPSKRLRGPIARGLGNKTDEPRVDREGGDRKAGLIRGASIIVEGEALGHDAWVDATLLSQVADQINASELGIKARFTHPSLSGDGLGSMFARAKNASVEGDRVVADLHMTEAGHSTPDGDLAAYVMDLAEQDGDAFGVSISFTRDIGEEKKFAAQNSDERGRFQSPDKRNKDNYRHFRLARLIAADVVDEPAANPDGLFTKASQRIAHEGADLIAFAIGQTDETPVLTALDIDPTRIRDFAKRYLAEHGLAIVNTSERKSQMDPETKTDDTAEQLDSDTPATPETPKADATETSKSVDEAVQEALAEERDRVKELTALGSKFGFGEDAEKFIADGKSVEEFRSHILNKSPDDWKESLSVRNPAQQDLGSEDDDSGSDAVSKIKARRKEQFGN